MTTAEFRAVEVVAALLPAIGKALDRIAAAQERIANAEETDLKTVLTVLAAFARQANNQLPAASAEGTNNNPTNKD